MYGIAYKAAVTKGINQYLYSQKPPHTSPSWASHGISVARVLEKIDRCYNSVTLCYSIFPSMSFSRVNWLYLQNLWLDPYGHVLLLVGIRASDWAQYLWIVSWWVHTCKRNSISTSILMICNYRALSNAFQCVPKGATYVTPLIWRIITSHKNCRET